MCIRCRNLDDELAKFVAEHSKECHARERGETCAIPYVDEPYRDTTWWQLAVVHGAFGIVLDRMEKAKELFDRPQDIPADVLREWEQHTIEAAERLARARSAREAIERERGKADDRRVQ